MSADCAHGTHPNYPERHEPDHWVALNGGPVIKLNTSARYATESTTAAVFVRACEQADVPTQWFVTRSDLACGSTIGPLTAAQLGMATVDVGVAQLAMHSCRELAGSHDPGWFIAALESFFGAPERTVDDRSVGHDDVERDVPLAPVDVIDLLERVGQPDEHRAGATRIAAKRERGVVVARAMAEASARCVERDERHEHHIEALERDAARRGQRLVDAEAHW